MSGRFDYVKYDSISTHQQEVFKNKFGDIEAFANETLADSRAKSLLMTALEEAYMWTGKAIRDEQIKRSINTEHVPERGE